MMAKTCAVADCGGDASTRGYCNRHYHKLMRYGSPTGGSQTKNGEPLNWLRNCLATSTDECMLWPFGGGAYGRVLIDGKYAPSHRYVCFLVQGAPPSPEYEAAHDCGKSRCCNPNHIAWKLHADNIADKRKHGTLLVGEKHHQAKLTSVDVLAIRASRRVVSRKSLAKQYSVGRSTIDCIMDRRTWTHV